MLKSLLRLAALAAAILSATAAESWAQSDDPVSSAPIRIGILGLAPRLVLTNLGIDTNVFNDRDDAKRDFTAELSPGAEVWMRAGRGLVTAGAQLDLTYFQRYPSERSVGGSGSLRYDHRFNRLVPFASIAASNTKQRPGYEIDARARSIGTAARAGAALRIGPKTTAELAGRYEKLSYDGDAVFDGRPLNQSLNRELTAADLTWTQRLTVLTTWVVRASAEREQFEFSPERDSRGVRVATGFELGRLALIRGRALVGYRRLEPAAGATIPAFSGVTAEVGVTYSAPTKTRIQVDSSRDIQYSFQRLTPYYVQTGVRGTLTQVIIGKWDVQIHGGQDRLAYRAVVEAAGAARVDRVDRFGGGVGYQTSSQLRVGVNVESFYRQSDAFGRGYHAVRAGATVNYGF